MHHQPEASPDARGAGCAPRSPEGVAVTATVGPCSVISGVLALGSECAACRRGCSGRKGHEASRAGLPRPPPPYAPVRHKPVPFVYPLASGNILPALGCPDGHHRRRGSSCHGLQGTFLWLTPPGQCGLLTPAREPRGLAGSHHPALESGLHLDNRNTFQEPHGLLGTGTGGQLGRYLWGGALGGMWEAGSGPGSLKDSGPVRRPGRAPAVPSLSCTE